MTFNEFRKDFFMFLKGSTVNLGRRTAKTRSRFISTAEAKFDTFISKTNGKPIEEKSVPKTMGSSIICIKPSDKKKSLDVGKGVHAMTGSESMRADEQLDRSPYVSKNEKKGQ